MTPPATAVPDQRDEFLAAVGASKLLTTTQMVRAAEAVAVAPPTARDAAKALVTAGHLTKFQVERLLAGRAGDLHLGPYVLLDQVGHGGNGRVFKARHRAMSRLMAVKVLSPGPKWPPTTRAEFESQVRAAARLGHPNVASVYDVSEHAGRSYVAMEFVDGPNLAALVKSRGALPPVEASELGRQAASGIEHAHAAGLAHLALKPENVLVARPCAATPEPLVKITDFGFGRLTATPGVTQTPPPGGWAADYLAPEQLSTPPVAGYQSDLYSLGAVLYFLLAGRPPFPGGTLEEKARRHLWEEPARLEFLRPGVPPPLAALVHQMLAKNPTHRPASATEVAERLGAHSSAHGGTVCFDLPPAPHGQLSFASGQLSGGYPAAAGFPDSGAYAVARSGTYPVAVSATPTPEPSPWAAFADTGTPAAETIDANPTRPTRRRRGLSAMTMGVLATSIVLMCLVATGVMVKALAK